MVVRKTSGRERERDVQRERQWEDGWRKLQNDQLNDFYPSIYVTWLMNFGRIRQDGHVEPTGKMYTEFQPEDLKLDLRVDTIFILKAITEYSKGNKTVPGKVATTRTEDGHKQNTKTSVTI